jgi:hypothetical protein
VTHLALSKIFESGYFVSLCIFGPLIFNTEVLGGHRDAIGKDDDHVFSRGVSIDNDGI